MQYAGNPDELLSSVTWRRGPYYFWKHSGKPKVSKTQDEAHSKDESKEDQCVTVEGERIRIIVNPTSLEVICLPICINGESTNDTEGNEDSEEEDGGPNLLVSTSLPVSRKLHHSIWVCYRRA